MTYTYAQIAGQYANFAAIASSGKRYYEVDGETVVPIPPLYQSAATSNVLANIIMRDGAIFYDGMYDSRLWSSHTGVVFPKDSPRPIPRTNASVGFVPGDAAISYNNYPQLTSLTRPCAIEAYFGGDVSFYRGAATAPMSAIRLMAINAAGQTYTCNIVNGANSLFKIVSISRDSLSATVTTSTEHYVKKNDYIAFSDAYLYGAPINITQAVRSSNVATLTIGSHSFVTGNYIKVEVASDPTFNGVFLISGVGATTVSYSNSGANITLNPATNTYDGAIAYDSTTPYGQGPGTLWCAVSVGTNPYLVSSVTSKTITFPLIQTWPTPQTMSSTQNIKKVSYPVSSSINFVGSGSYNFEFVGGQECSGLVFTEEEILVYDTFDKPNLTTYTTPEIGPQSLSWSNSGTGRWEVWNNELYYTVSTDALLMFKVGTEYIIEATMASDTDGSGLWIRSDGSNNGILLRVYLDNFELYYGTPAATGWVLMHSIPVGTTTSYTMRAIVTLSDIWIFVNDVFIARIESSYHNRNQYAGLRSLNNTARFNNLKIWRQNRSEQIRPLNHIMLTFEDAQYYSDDPAMSGLDTVAKFWLNGINVAAKGLNWSSVQNIQLFSPSASQEPINRNSYVAALAAYDYVPSERQIAAHAAACETPSIDFGGMFIWTGGRWINTLV